MTKLASVNLPATVGEISPPCQIITLQSDSGVALDGVIYSAEHPKAIVVHLHGSLGNFYQNHFLRTLASEYLQLGICLLSVNLRSHDGIAEAIDLDRQRTVYVGGALLPFESCIPDINGVLNWAEHWDIPVVLQGHSLGCDRVVAFALDRRWTGLIVLLSPCDSKELQLRWAKASGVDWEARTNSREPYEELFSLLSVDSYGVIGSNDLWKYAIPTSARTLFSIMNGVPGTVFHLRKELVSRLDNKGYCYIGASDEILTAPPDVFAERIRCLAPNIAVNIREGGHHDLSTTNGWVCRDIAIGVAGLI